MNIALIGRTEILYSTAIRLQENGHRIRLIVTSKEAPEYKKTADDFKSLAHELNAEYIYSANINSKEIFDKIKNINSIDIGVSLNYVNIISQKIIDLFPHGILNAHGGDLPRYRGNACQAWAIINGESKIGLCIHKMDGSRLDSGDIIARDYLEININTKIGSVWSWMGERIPFLFLQAINQLALDKNFIIEKQSDKPEDQLRCYPRRAEDNKIDWNQSNKNILRLINSASQPFSGAFCKYKGVKMVIWDAELYEDEEIYCAIPGQVSIIDKNDGFIVVITGNGKLRINEISYKDYSGKPNNIIKSIRSRLV
jgi:UDP-4-amino-4-deoxy-L-arabinose formyltransferase/UDP-glucuronic acid dehydrogenase (UDP-4-keto-hexauronic acid decarboxylating)